jgi:hypothetical protein
VAFARIGIGKVSAETPTLRRVIYPNTTLHSILPLFHALASPQSRIFTPPFVLQWEGNGEKC